MATQEKAANPDGATRLINSIEDAERSSLEAVRKFVDTVDGVFPDLVEDGPRRKIIDSAFKMVDQLVTTSSRLAQNIVSTTEASLGELEKKNTASAK